MPCAGRLARAEQIFSRELCVHFEKSLFQIFFYQKTRPHTIILMIIIQGRVSMLSHLDRGTTSLTSHL